MIEVSVPKTNRRFALALGEEYGIAPFYAMGLMHLDRREAIAVCEQGLRWFPTDADGRERWIRRTAISNRRGTPPGRER